jgi:site-specific recombinase XerD
MITKLFQTFLQEKRYLSNLSPKTLISYEQSYNTYQRILSKPELPTSEEMNLPTKDTLRDFVIGMRERGLSPGACNVYIRSMNSFLSWLHQGGYVTEPLRLRQLPKPNTIIRIFTDTLKLSLSTVQRTSTNKGFML